MRPRTRSARLALLFVAVLAVVVGVLLLDRGTATDRAEPATVVDGRYYPPGGMVPDGVWLVTVETDKGETVTAVRPRGLPGLKAGDRVELVARRGVVGVTSHLEVR